MSIVYIHRRNDTNEVFYIGKGIDIKRSKSKVSRNIHWWNIVNKYGYSIEILYDDLTDEEAQTREIELISEYGRIDINTGILVNMTSGGTGTKDYFKQENTVLKQNSRHIKPVIIDKTTEQMITDVKRLQEQLPDWWTNYKLDQEEIILLST